MRNQYIDLGSVAPGLVVGLFGFAFTSFGPPKTHWIAPLIFTGIVGITNYAVYKSSIDYMVSNFSSIITYHKVNRALDCRIWAIRCFCDRW